jgi:hypothetical protein
VELVRTASFSGGRMSALLAILLALALAQTANAANKGTHGTPGIAPDHATLDPGSIPPGTILPIRLGSLSSEKSKSGARIKARIMQDVPLGNGEKLRAGSTVLGFIVSATSPGPGTKATLTLRFSEVVVGKQSVPVVTHLRAMASTLEVESAQTPTIGPGESDVYDWLTTVQVGGEVVYGKGGEVTNGDRVVGRSTYDGVLAQVNVREGTNCHGPVDGDDRPQAFWVFSSDACGAYGFPRLTIGHSGRTDPRGEIVLVSEQGPVKIRSGSGMLLRVQR